MEVALGPRPGVMLGWDVAAAAHSEFPGDFLLVLFFICWLVSKSGLWALKGGGSGVVKVFCSGFLRFFWF